MEQVTIVNQGRLKERPRCPKCHKMLDGYSCTDGGARPSEGDFSVCFYCYHLLRFINKPPSKYLSLCYASQTDFKELKDFPFKTIVNKDKRIVIIGPH